MPIDKSKQKVYGRIVGHLQNMGYGFETAKNKADKAVKDMMNKKKKKKKGY